MKDLKIISEGDNYAAIDLGAFENLKNHSFKRGHSDSSFYDKR